MTEFQPLYPPGFHDIMLEDLENIFVLPFSDNERRKYLTERFMAFIEKFSELGLNVEIWLDGSYSTQKPEPNDMDILIVVDPVAVAQIPTEKQLILQELFDRNISKIRYSIDVLISPSDDANMRSYWRGWFGYSRTEQPKGIPRLFYGFN